MTAAFCHCPLLQPPDLVYFPGEASEPTVSTMIGGITKMETIVTNVNKERKKRENAHSATTETE